MMRFSAPIMACCVGALLWGGLITGPKAGAQATPTLRVPAFTAFVTPDCEALDVSAQEGLTGWKSAKERVYWIGRFNATGSLELALAARLPNSASSRFRLTVEQATAKSSPDALRWSGKQERIAEAKNAPGSDGSALTIPFSPVTISAPGIYRFTLEGLAKTGPTFGDLDALLLSGPTTQNAHFNLLPEQRGAPSVHLSYPTPPNAPIVWFYNEVTVKTDPLWSYYMACGWHRGYFGIQINSPTERRIIFSVWDSGSEAVDRNKVAQDNRVQLLAKGPDVFSDSFGNEGTGGHSHLVYPWKTEHTYRFLVTAQPNGNATIYSGYFFFPEHAQWGLIARFRAPKDGAYLHGLYSFNEDFNGANGDQHRRAEFGRQWIKTADGAWSELTTAYFTHTGKTSRTDYNAGAAGNRFYLANGGFMDGSVHYRDMVHRPASGKPPTDITLPAESTAQPSP